MSDTLLRVEGLSVHVGAVRYCAVSDVSFEVREGEHLALLGPSGCGKTSSLRAIAGFERASEGRIVFDGRTLSSSGAHVPPHAREIGMMFQDFALFPHLDVGDNVAFGLTKLAREERRVRVADTLALVGLSDLAHRKPGELSGGQEQRVALARALAPRPRLVLLDEPFSSLDANLRAATRAHTARALEAVSATALLVTHDQAEALSFAARLVVLRDGRVEQDGTPEGVYQRPKSAFVARFLGAANLVSAVAAGDHATTALGVLALDGNADGDVVLCVRPENVALSTPTEDTTEVRATVVTREYHGATSTYVVRGEGFELSALVAGGPPWTVGDPVSVRVVGPAAPLS